MKKKTLILLAVLAVVSLLLSACGPVQGSSGDDGGISLDNADLQESDDNENDLSNSTDDNENDDANSNESNSNDVGTSSSDGALEYVGVLEVLGDDQVQIDGMIFNLAEFTEFKGTFETGDVVKVHVSVAEDGSFIILEIELADLDDNPGWDDDNVNNSNDDDGNSNDGNDNDDNANDDDSNDNVSNSNDDDSNDNDSDSNSNDDDSNDNDSGSNSNDDDHEDDEKDDKEEKDDD